MCFHNSMSAKAIKLATRYGRKSDIIEIYRDVLNEQYHINAFNFPKYPIITASDEIQVFNWGLIPFWVKTEEDAEEMRKMTLNARAETIFEKPSFRESIMRKRCIVPSTGYFEWRHEESRQHATFSIITTATNSLTDYIHNTKHRMPAILSPEDEEQWLNPELSRENIEYFFKPYSSDEMGAYPIGNDFIKKMPTDKSILQRA